MNSGFASHKRRSRACRNSTISLSDSEVRRTETDTEDVQKKLDSPPLFPNPGASGVPGCGEEEANCLSGLERKESETEFVPHPVRHPHSRNTGSDIHKRDLFFSNGFSP